MGWDGRVTWQVKALLVRENMSLVGLQCTAVQITEGVLRVRVQVPDQGAV